MASKRHTRVAAEMAFDGGFSASRAQGLSHFSLEALE